MSENSAAQSSGQDAVTLRRELDAARQRIAALEAELVEERSFLDTLLETTPDFFALKDRDFVYRRVSPALCRFLGKSAEEMIGKHDEELFSPEEAAMHVGRDATVLKTRQPLEGDWSIAGPEGKFWFRVKKTPVFDDSGEVSGIFCMVRDVSRRKKAEMEFDRFFNFMPELVCIASVSGYFIKVNAAWRKTLGYTEEELLSTPFVDLLHPDDIASTKAEFERRQTGHEG